MNERDLSITIVCRKRLGRIQQCLEQRLGHPGLDVEEGVTKSRTDLFDNGGGCLPYRPVVLLEAGS